MKYLCFSTVLATVLSSSTCNAFSTPKSPLLFSSQARYSTLLQSSLVEETDALTTQSTKQQLTTEEQQLQSFTDSAANQKSYLDDGFVFGLNDSGLERPKGKEASVVVEGDSLETTPQQVGIVSATFGGHALFAANAIHNLYEQTNGDIGATALTSVATIVASWIAADFGSGVFHWSVDNYGNGRTPVMGNIIAAFQGHHSAPWTITYRGFCNNVWKLCIPFGIPTIAAITLLAGEEHPMGKYFKCMVFYKRQLQRHLISILTFYLFCSISILCCILCH